MSLRHGGSRRSLPSVGVRRHMHETPRRIRPHGLHEFFRRRHETRPFLHPRHTTAFKGLGVGAYQGDQHFFGARPFIARLIHLRDRPHGHSGPHDHGTRQIIQIVKVSGHGLCRRFLRFHGLHRRLANGLRFHNGFRRRRFFCQGQYGRGLGGGLRRWQLH